MPALSFFLKIFQIIKIKGNRDSYSIDLITNSQIEINFIDRETKKQNDVMFYKN